MSHHRTLRARAVAWLVPSVLLACSGAAHALEFHGIPLGASEATLVRALPVFSCRTPTKAGSGDRLCTAAQDVVPGKIGLPAAAIFVRDRLSWLIFKLQVGQFPALIANLKARLGEPTTHDVADFRTQAGVEVANDVYTWRVGDEVVEARRFGESLGTSVMHFRFSGVRAEIDGAPSAAPRAIDPTM